MDDQYSLYGVKLPGPGPGPSMAMGPRGPPAAARAPFPTPAGPPYDVTRYDIHFQVFHFLLVLSLVSLDQVYRRCVSLCASDLIKFWHKISTCSMHVSCDSLCGIH